MKNVKKINGFVFTFIFNLLIPIFLSAQIYTEVQNYGWGMGIDDTAPVIEDIDGDGLFDLLLGNDNGTIWHFEQYALKDLHD